MLKQRIDLLLFVLMVFNQISLSAQSDSVSVISHKDFATEDITNDESQIMIKLPPLATFFKNIHEHPSVGIYETYKDEALAELGEEKQKWLDYLRIVANYQYGRNHSFSENESIIESQLLLSNKAMNNYGVGVALSIPIGDLASRNKRIKSKKAVVKRVQYEYDLAVEQRKFMILEAYNAVVELLATLRAKSEAAALYNAQISITEENFKMGKIDIVQLSLEKSRRAGAVVSYEEGKVSLHNSITLLEMLSNVKVLNN